MRLVDQVSYDIACLDKYIIEMLVLFNKNLNQEINIDLTTCDDFPPQISHFIKPAITCAIYSTLEFWLQQICNYHAKSKNLSQFNKKNRKEESEILQMHHYLIRDAHINLSDVEINFQEIDNNLRVVRNKFIHTGAHISEKEITKFNTIERINISAGLIVVSEFLYKK